MCWGWWNIVSKVSLPPTLSKDMGHRLEPRVSGPRGLHASLEKSILGKLYPSF